ESTGEMQAAFDPRAGEGNQLVAVLELEAEGEFELGGVVADAGFLAKGSQTIEHHAHRSIRSSWGRYSCLPFVMAGRNACPTPKVDSPAGPQRRRSVAARAGPSPPAAPMLRRLAVARRRPTSRRRLPQSASGGGRRST